MRLNPDCIRDILFAVEENTGYHSVMSIDEENYTEFQQLSKYEYGEVAYHINQCNLSGYFTEFSAMIDDSYMIVDLTPKGHEFLANIRSESAWKEIMDKASKIGSFSLPFIAEVAAQYFISKI